MNEILLEEHHGHRATLVRKAVIHTPTATLAWVLALSLLGGLLQGNLGVIVGLVIVGVVAFALSFEAIAALRDLRTEPVTTHGAVQRLWTKGRVFFLGRVNYLFVQGRVFEVTAPTYAGLAEDDTVEVVHWPHTNILVTVSLMQQAGGAAQRQSRSSIPPPR